MNHIKPYDEFVTGETKIGGQTLDYWLNYDDDKDPHALGVAKSRLMRDITLDTPDFKIRMMINLIIDRYRTNDGETLNDIVFNEKELFDDMYNLCKCLLKLQHRCNKGCLEAYCMQNIDAGPAHSVSDKLTRHNDITGTFD